MYMYKVFSEFQELKDFDEKLAEELLEEVIQFIDIREITNGEGR